MRSAVALTAAITTAVGVAPRVLLADGSLPEVLRPFVWSDALHVYERGLSGRRLPYADTPFEYPPLIGAMAGLFSQLSGDARDFVLFWGIVQILCAALVAWLLAGRAEPARVRSRFALSPQLLLLGALNFDLVAILLVVYAITAARRADHVRSAVAVALGTAAKLFPVVAAPLIVIRSAAPWRTGAIIGGVLGLAYLPAAIAGSSGATGPLYYLVAIPPNLDSHWGMLAALGAALGLTAAVPAVTAITLVGLATTYVAVVLPRARAADPAAPIGLAVVTTLLWSRLYSPQYSLWVLPFFALLALPTRQYALLVLGDLLVLASISPLTLARWPANDPLQIALLAILVVGVGLRTAALVLTWGTLRTLARPVSRGLG